MPTGVATGRNLSMISRQLTLALLPFAAKAADHVRIPTGPFESALAIWSLPLAWISPDPVRRRPFRLSGVPVRRRHVTAACNNGFVT